MTLPSNIRVEGRTEYLVTTANGQELRTQVRVIETNDRILWLDMLTTSDPFSFEVPVWQNKLWWAVKLNDATRVSKTA